MPAVTQRILLPLLTVVAGCVDEGSPAGPRSAVPFECASPASATRPDPLQWKRVRALDNDLRAALSLGPTQVCAELDRFPCTDVHRVPLGGNDPFGAALYEPVARPLATTPMAVDRVVLGSCVNRVDLDRTGPPVVFTHFDLDGSTDLSSPEHSAAVDAQSTDLVRRLLARQPRTEELTALKELTVDDSGSPVTPRDFAVLACFTIGSSTEFLFF